VLVHYLAAAVVADPPSHLREADEIGEEHRPIRPVDYLVAPRG
jgi:hypothetical protein